MTGDWRDSAACARIDPAVFFPAKINDTRCRAVIKAKAFCRGCPVLTQCRTEALGRPEEHEHGIFAGLTPRERTAIREGRDAKRRRMAARDPLILDRIRAGQTLTEIRTELGVTQNQMQVSLRRLRAAGHEIRLGRALLKDPTPNEKCGTRAGQRIHNKRGERSCPACVGGGRRAGEAA